MHDNKHGNYVVLLGVTDRGYPDMCTLAVEDEDTQIIIGYA
jgi:hypothetical protein